MFYTTLFLKMLLMYKHWHILKTNYINRSFLYSRKVECQKSTKCDKLKVLKQKALHKICSLKQLHILIYILHFISGSECLFGLKDIQKSFHGSKNTRQTVISPWPTFFCFDVLKSTFIFLS